MPLEPHRLASTRHAPIRAVLGATLLALTTAAASGEAEPPPEEHPADPASEGSAAPPGDVPAPKPEGTGAAPANPALPVAPQPTSPPPPAAPPAAPPIYTPGYPSPYAPGYAPQPYTPGYPPSPYGPGYSPQGADTAWPPPPPEPPGMNDATMFYASAVLMGIGCAMMTPVLLRTDLALGGGMGYLFGAMAIFGGGIFGYPLYLATTPLAMTGALPALAPDQERRSDGALAAGIVLTMLGAAAAPLGVFFTSTAARSDFDPGPGIGLLVATGVGLGSGVPLMVWGAAPVEAQPPPPPYFGLRF